MKFKSRLGFPLYCMFFLLCLSIFFFISLLSTLKILAQDLDVQDVKPGQLHKDGLFPTVEIPAGSFMMGSPESEYKRDIDEVLHKVEISRSFLIGQYEVTQKQWKEVMGTSPSYFKDCGSDCPVEMVSWYEAVMFSNRLSEKEGFEKCYEVAECSGTLGGGCSDSDGLGCLGDYKCGKVRFKETDCKGYRLPTESEWEYMSRAGQSNPDDLNKVAWYQKNSTYSPHSVGLKQANYWNIYDSLGNVYEWVWDYQGEYPEGDITDPVGPSAGDTRVCRGGGWDYYARGCRSAERVGFVPIYRLSFVGFRLARSL